MNNHGPAKPQRTLAASTSPLMLSRDSLAGDSGSKSSPNKICMENVSFANNSSSSKPSPECTLMNPNPLIIDADAEVENDGELTPTNMGLTDLLAKFNLSWDYVTNLQERYLEKEDIMLRQQQCLPPDPPLPPCGHERRDSFDNSSSGCSDVGSTFKEIFGPIKYDEWMAPLASPETLSEISSLSSRASFLIPKDQSPLLRMKGMKNGTSSSLHRYKNGKANGFGLGAPCSTFHNNNGHHHSRSFSCTYPEISDVSIISSGLCGQSQSTKGSFYYGSSNGGSKIQLMTTTVVVLRTMVAMVLAVVVDLRMANVILSSQNQIITPKVIISRKKIPLMDMASRMTFSLLQLRTPRHIMRSQ